MSIQADKTEISRICFEKINLSNIELYSIIKENLIATRPIYPLIEFAISRFSTVTELATNDHLWDAEIIYRSALEATIKLVFITTASGDERNVRIQEYWTDLSEINSIKISEHAKKNIKARGTEDQATLIFRPLVLDESQV